MSDVRAAGFVPYRIEEGNLLFLLLKAAGHSTWGFPKGLIDVAEEEDEAARREMAEETGISGIRPVEGFRETVKYIVHLGGKDSNKRSTYFLAGVGGSPVTLSHEHTEYRWLPASEAMSMIPFENLRRVLAKAVACLWRQGEGFPWTPLPKEPLSAREAEVLLHSMGSLDDRWVRHCLEVAHVAVKIGTALKTSGQIVDLDFLHEGAVLHDIGRALDHGDHGIQGFLLLRDLGLACAARVSITHYLKGRSAEELSTDGFRSDSNLSAVGHPDEFRPLSLEEKVVAVADACVAGDTMTGMDERFRLARLRYGDTPWMTRNEALSRAWLAEFEGMTGGPIQLDRGVPTS
ncbi:MAG: NUDIX domain-containing protein [Planctomycetota bacterium]